MKESVVATVTATLLALKERGVLTLSAGVPAFVVEPAKNPLHGDFACNVAMTLSKSEGKAPRAIADAIVAGLVDDAKLFTKVEVAGPGFLNLTLADRAFHNVVRDVARAGHAWGRSPATGKKVLVEFVSANPTGPIHIGHARGTFVGDALARLLAAAGHDVTREFYANDYGNQVDVLARTIYKRYRELSGESITLGEGEYPGEYVKDIARVWHDEDGDRWLTSDEAAALVRAQEIGIRENLKAIRETLILANVTHDVYFGEATLHESGKVLRTAQEYIKLGTTYEADVARGTEDKKRRGESKAAQFEDRQGGGTWLMTSLHGDEEDRVILRKDGTPVYLTADLTYHHEKFLRGFDRIIDVFGADHAGHIGRLKAGMKLLGLDEKKLEFVIVQMVRIVRSGTEVKASKRKGNIFELKDLIEEAGVDACRFMFLMKTTSAQMEFDLDLIQKQSKENPVFYFQYGHARCAAVLRKAIEEGQPFVGFDAVTDEQLATLVLPEEKLLLKKMSQLPEMVAGAASASEPHRVLYFCQELISEFHSYYTKYKRTERVVSADKVKTQGRLALVATLKQTLKNAFLILGVDAPDVMTRADDDDDEAAGA
ncbi:MAG: arginine--tRNA ligase [Deltaproteobacteria bacterium]|nr:arginine--tRNA ligase [Deltaproteobacteria bacterium]